MANPVGGSGSVDMAKLKTALDHKKIGVRTITDIKVLNAAKAAGIIDDQGNFLKGGETRTPFPSRSRSGSASSVDSNATERGTPPPIETPPLPPSKRGRPIEKTPIAAKDPIKTIATKTANGIMKSGWNDAIEEIFKANPKAVKEIKTLVKDVLKKYIFNLKGQSKIDGNFLKNGILGHLRAAFKGKVYPNINESIIKEYLEGLNSPSFTEQWTSYAQLINDKLGLR